MSPEDRAQLAEQQAALVRALAGQEAAPSGFDAEHVAIAAASLLAKRARGVEKGWPELTASLGPRFRAIFAEYAKGQPMPPDGTDGRRFARHVLRRGQLSDAGRVQLLLAEMDRRPIGIARLPVSRNLVLALRAFGSRWLFTLPIIKRRPADFSQPLSPAAK
jgi:hypothetical protein